MKEQKNDLKFEKVYVENWEQVFNYVQSRIRNTEDAEDITMQVFDRVLKHLPDYDPQKGQFNTWLFTITNRLIIDHFRSNKSAMFINVAGYVDDNGNESFQFETPCNSDMGIENEELKTKLDASIDSLTGLHKRVAQLFLVEEKSHSEVSELLNIPIGTVKGTINRAKNKLQAMLQREFAML